jgi:hypothetical protein
MARLKYYIFWIFNNLIYVYLKYYNEIVAAIMVVIAIVLVSKI